MTNEDAICILLNSNEYHHAKGDLPHSAASVEAFNKAIDALKTAERADAVWQKGVEQGFAIGFEHGKHERPKGEWIFKKFDEETGIANSDWCPFCGMVKAQVYDNFCSYCGADMQKDGAE